MPKPVKAAKAAKPPVKATLPASIVKALPSSAAFMRHMSATEAEIRHIQSELAKARKGGAVAMARAFVALHRLIERTDGILKPVYDTFNEYKTQHIPALFEQEDVPNVPLNEGFRVGVSHKFVASIKTGEKDRAYQWLRENGLGDLIQGTVNSSSLTASAKSLMEEKNVELPSELFNTGFVPNTSVTVI